MEYEVVLQILPTERSFIPRANEINEALHKLQEFFPLCDDVTDDIYDTVMLHDCGSLLSDMVCPYCQVTTWIGFLSDDNNGRRWWRQIIENLYKEKKDDDLLIVETPCCQKTGELGKLNFEPDMGFAKFVLEVWNPIPAEEISPCGSPPDEKALSIPQLLILEEILGCNLKQIWFQDIYH